MTTFGRRSVDAEVTADKTGRFGMRSRGRRTISSKHTRMEALVPMQFMQSKVRDDLDDRFWLCCLRFASERCI